MTNHVVHSYPLYGFTQQPADGHSTDPKNGFRVRRRLPRLRDPLPAVDLTKVAGGMTKNGAEVLANTIRTYWRRMGWTVKVWAERQVAVLAAAEQGKVEQSDRREDAFWVVKSDMIGGLPKEAFAYAVDIDPDKLV